MAANSPELFEQISHLLINVYGRPTLCQATKSDKLFPAPHEFFLYWETQINEWSDSHGHLHNLY